MLVLRDPDPELSRRRRIWLPIERPGAAVARLLRLEGPGGALELVRIEPRGDGSLLARLHAPITLLGDGATAAPIVVCVIPRGRGCTAGWRVEPWEAEGLSRLDLEVLRRLVDDALLDGWWDAARVERDRHAAAATRIVPAPQTA